jgi:oligoendopeptidase F
VSGLTGPDRSSQAASDPPVPARTWRLADIYPHTEAWEEERERLVARMAELDALQGRLAEGSHTVLAALELLFDLHRLAGRLHTYASLMADQDLRAPGPQAMKENIVALYSDLAARAAWVDPELLGLAPETLARHLASEPRLAPYRRYLEKLEKRRAHTLDEAGERLLGLSQLIRGTGETVSGLLRNAEIPWREITLSDGTTLSVDANGYTRARTLPHREDRLQAFQAFHGVLRAFRGSLGATVYGSTKEHVFSARARGFASTLEAALHPNEVDPAVYHMLVREVNAALPSLHRYLRLRARILGVEPLAYHDLYPPLVPEVKVDYSWERARETVLAALAPLGDEYVDRLRHALTDRWVDVDPRPGKRAGAYVNDGSYGCHPYMLLNHQNDYHSASTLAHESGHLMHSWYSQEVQPLPTSRYVIFVAEVASTFNEGLLLRHLLAATDDAEQRLALLGHHLDNLRGTVFRQTMFAEFELEIHRRVEEGEALTGESLTDLYFDLLRRYHGVEQGVMTIDELYGNEWGFVPHFHYNFYVYQYATSYVAATALLRDVIRRDGAAVERFLEFLRQGSAQPPVDLLRSAGVDMTSPAPIQATIREMEEVMDSIDDILARRER